MMKYLAVRNLHDFNEMVGAYPSIAEHLMGYGIVARGAKSYFFNIGVVEGFFENEARPVVHLGAHERLAEISAKRNELERAMRRKIKLVFEVQFSPSKRVGEVVASLQQERREKLAARTFDDLLSEGDSPLYFLELKGVVEKHWGMFQHTLGVQKGEFSYHAGVINGLRADAHAKDVSDEEFEKVRISFREIGRMFSV